MKVQWQLVDVETKKAIPVGEVFEIVEHLDFCFDNKPMSWDEAAFLFGDPFDAPPAGIIMMGVSPIAAARKTMLNNGDCLIKEATEDRGGVNEKPTSPPPKNSPKGQGWCMTETVLFDGKCPECGSLDIKRGAGNMWCNGCGYFPINLPKSETVLFVGGSADGTRRELAIKEDVIYFDQIVLSPDGLRVERYRREVIVTPAKSYYFYIISTESPDNLIPLLVEGYRNEKPHVL